VLVREAARRLRVSYDLRDSWYIRVFSSGELTHLSLLYQSQPPPSLSPGPGQYS
jgi:hypothetical protein